MPSLPRRSQAAIRVEAPLLLSQMAGVMMRPPRTLVRTYAIPREVLREAYGPDSASRQDVRDSLSKIRNLLTDLGLVTPASQGLWRRLGLWDD